MLEHLRPKLTRDSAYFFERGAYRLLCLVDLVAVFRGGVGDRVQLQEDAGQDLPDLVVQVTSDADPFALLCREDTFRALVPLAFETVEHPVEGTDDAADLIATAYLQPLAAAKQVDGFHPLR